MRRRVVGSVLAVGLAATACSESPPAAPETAEPAPIASTAAPAGGPGLPVYGLGGFDRAVPARPCLEPMHRQFDFWLGEWDVFNPAGVQVGTNVVESLLDGCVVAENWVSGGGVPGRSINTFDAETGQWHQTWVSANNRGHLRMAGGVDDEGRMVLEGRRDSRFGFTLFDEFVWTVLGPDEVRQMGSVRVPALDVESSFVGVYRRADDLSPSPETPTQGCQPGGESEATRELDFWLGSWEVEAENGRSLGTSRVTTDLSGCLVEERFETPGGYRAVSFAHWDFWEGTWYRTYIDSEGERIELSGASEGSGLLLSGAEAGPGHSGRELQLRVRLEPEGLDVVRQTWETSRDAGESWKEAVVLVYRRTGEAPEAARTVGTEVTADVSGAVRPEEVSPASRLGTRLP